MNLNFDPLKTKKSKYAITKKSCRRSTTYVYDSDEDEDIEFETAMLKSAIALKSLEEKQVILKKYNKMKSKYTKRAKRRKCMPYDPNLDRPYEEFIMYYQILKMLIIIEEKKCKKYKPTCQSAINRSFDRYTDLGMPSITAYSPWKQPVKYVAFGLTLIGAIFKLVQAQNGGKASFMASVIQAFAHLMFTVFFLINKNDRDLAIPKIIGFVFSSITAVLIASAGNGFL